MEISVPKLKIWQKDVLDRIIQDGMDSDKTYVIKSKRQVGKSTLLEVLLLNSAINHSGSVSICVSVTLVQSRKIYKDIISLLAGTNIISKQNDALLELGFINGSTIYFKSAAQKESLRGFTVKRGGILVIDEAAFIGEDIYPLLYPFTSVNHAPIVMCSTPTVKSGTFYNNYSLGMSSNIPGIVSFDWSSYDTSEMLSDDKLEMYRKTLPVNQFRNEFLGEFTDDGGSVFQMSSIKWNKRTPDPSSYNHIYLGIDWSTGSGNDYTVLSGFNEHGEQVILKYNNHYSPQNMIQWLVKNINEKLDIKKLRTILVEENSIGKIYLDLLRSALPKLNIKPFNTTNASKREIVEDFCADIGNGDITLLEDEEQYKQLSQYAMEITSTGKITYNGYLAHDDVVIADCLARHASKNKTNYTISFGKR